MSVSAMASLVTILFAIAGGTLGKGDGPSFIGQEKLSAGAPVAAPTIVEAPVVPRAVPA